MGVNQLAQLLGVGKAPRHLCHRQRILHHPKAAHQHGCHLQRNHHTHGSGQREMVPKTRAQVLYVDVHHHHHEQEQHHHRPYVDQHQGDGQKLGFEQHPDHGGLEEGQHQKQRSVHRVAGRNHPKGREQQDR